MNVAVYFRYGDWTQQEELNAARHYFVVESDRMAIPVQHLVIPRYSMLPFPEELERDVTRYLGGCLINSCAQHRFVADIWQWYPVIKDLTPRTWNNWANLTDGSYVVKGVTNSRKHEWNRRMFCPTVGDIPGVASSLLDDCLIKDQGIVVREYVPLEQFGVGINGLPITNEWRFFCYRGQVLCGGYYWSDHPEHKPAYSDPPDRANRLAKKVAQRLNGLGKTPFFVVDIAKTEKGKWIVIELNDGSMSGLSSIDPEEFYRKLRLALS